MLLFLLTRTCNDEQFHNDVSSDVNYVPQLLEIKLMLFMGSLLYTGWTKTRPAQKLLVRVKFTGNPYSYAVSYTHLTLPTNREV